eukprot:301992-Prymnesium_polylepis.1
MLACSTSGSAPPRRWLSRRLPQQSGGAGAWQGKTDGTLGVRTSRRAQYAPGERLSAANLGAAELIWAVGPGRLTEGTIAAASWQRAR